MEDSAYEAIYTGVYIFIFISALTITLFLFKSVYDVAEKSYEFGNIQDSSLIVQVPVDEERYLTGSEVISYIYNYIQRDIFGSNTINNEFIITVKNFSGSTVINRKLTGNNIYTQIIGTINVKAKYYLKYEKVDAGGKASIVIQQVV